MGMSILMVVPPLYFGERLSDFTSSQLKRNFIQGQACNQATCPSSEQNSGPFGLKTNALPTEPNPVGLTYMIFRIDFRFRIDAGIV